MFEKKNSDLYTSVSLFDWPLYRIIGSEKFLMVGISDGWTLEELKDIFSFYGLSKYVDIENY